MVKKLFVMCSLLLLAACGGGVKETLGLNREAPDEFRVVSRPPLSVPPQFSLRPPAAPGEVVPGEQADRKAKSLITGTGPDANTFVLPRGNVDTAVIPVESSPLSRRATPETNFLERAGAIDAQPNIRERLEQDKIAAHQTIEDDESWWDTFSILPGKKDPVVSAKDESARIKQNQADGKPVTEGDTPEAKQRDTGVLGRIFGY